MAKEDVERYNAAAHAMQTGVALKMVHEPHETNAKHLRVGVNAAMVDSAAIVTLLIAKGLITQDEFEKVLADQMEKEAESYRKYLADRFGGNVILG